MSHAQFRGLSIDMGVGIAMMKIEKVVARQNSLQIFSETPVVAMAMFSGVASSSVGREPGAFFQERVPQEP